MVPHKCHFNVIGYCVKWCRIFHSSTTPKIIQRFSNEQDSSLNCPPLCLKNTIHLVKCWKRDAASSQSEKIKWLRFVVQIQWLVNFTHLNFSNNRSINYGKKESFINLNRSCFLICNGQKLWAGSLTLFGALVGTLVN